MGPGRGRQTPPVARGGGHPPLRQTQRRNSSCCRSQRGGAPGVPCGPSSAPAAERGGAHGYPRGSSGRRGRSQPRPRSPPAGAAPPPAAARPPSAAAAAGVSGPARAAPPRRPLTGLQPAPQPRSRLCEIITLQIFGSVLIIRVRVPVGGAGAAPPALCFTTRECGPASPGQTAALVCTSNCGMCE